uniref:Palmitoyltransferase n=1 Tax=Syphacia muris TaxID=451379 RepID=A0A0N5AXK5_9BILA
MPAENVRQRAVKSSVENGLGTVSNSCESKIPAFVDNSGDNRNSNIEEPSSTTRLEIIEAPKWCTGLEDYENDFGKTILRRLLHWGTLTAIFIILLIGSSTTYIHLQWWPLTNIYSFMHLSIFLYFNYATLTNLCHASFIGPGYVPLHWKPLNEELKFDKHLQYCVMCEGYKAPRSHHCSRCGRCVMKMDHHCPWINNCVGHRNHAFFIRFLAAAVFGCIQAVYICGFGLYYGMFRMWYLRYGTGDEPDVVLTVYSFLIIFFAFGLALGVIVAVGFLLYVQLRIVFYNRTGVEEYIIGKAESYNRPKPFIYPYNLGWKRNLLEVLGSWNGYTRGNGIWWPVVAPTHQFTFSVRNLLYRNFKQEEQLYQKWLKRETAREYVIVSDYSGGIFKCVRFGFLVFFCQPWSDEPRVAVQNGEHWMITRGNKRWLYGRRKVDRELTTAAEIRSVPRGWFPRKCAERVTNGKV